MFNEEGLPNDILEYLTHYLHSYDIVSLYCISSYARHNLIEHGPYPHNGISLNCVSMGDLKIQLSHMISEIICFPRIKLKISPFNDICIKSFWEVIDPTTIVYLNMSNGIFVNKLEGLDDCKNLEELVLDFSNLRDVKNLKSLKLKALSIDGTNILHMQNFPKYLESFSMQGTLISSIYGIARCSNLRVFHAAYSLLESIDSLKSCINLKELILNNTHISDIDCIRYLKHLKKLNISNTNIDDISPIISCKKLMFVNLDDTLIDDLSYLSNCSNLRTISIVLERKLDITFIDDFRRLNMLIVNGLFISESQIKDLEKLRNCKKEIEVARFEPLRVVQLNNKLRRVKVI